MLVTLVPHTHWDREWYEPFAVFSGRLVVMMDTLLDLCAQGFPHFHLDGQTAMIDDYLARYPERADEVEAYVRCGRLSAGPWVTQMDEFLTSGESHIRNLEMGLRRARELGRALEVGYMPDQFGHIGQMPQILRSQGLDRAVVWRGVPAEIEATSFRWRSPDGSEVRTEYLVWGYFSGASLSGVEPDELARAISRILNDQRPFAVDDRALVMVGYDHSGPDAAFPERLGASPLPDDVEVHVEGLSGYLDGRSEPEDLPVWTGELRSGARAHLLPNVYSARVNQKRERGRLEVLLERYAEPLAALAPGFGWPEDELRHAWRLMLWNGAHDSACGCSHDQVAADVDSRFAKIRETCEDIVERALTSLGSRVSGPGGVIRFNPSPFERDGVPALGYQVVPTAHEPEPVPVDLEVVEDGDGVVLDGVRIRLFDEPDVGDLYTFCPAQKGQLPSPPGSIEVRDREVIAAWDRLLVLMRAVRSAGEPFIRLEGVVRNERPNHRLRLHVELPGPAHRSVAGAPFELVDRPLVGEGGPGEVPSSTWPARHIVIANRIAVLHEGVFEYEVFGGHELAVTSLRCVGRISAPSLETRPWAAGPETPTPNAQMIGETVFSLGIWPDAPASGAELLAGWERFAMPFAEAPAAGGGSLPESASLFDVDLDEGQLSSIRRWDGALEVRLWNPSADRTVTARVGDDATELGPAKILTLRM